MPLRKTSSKKIEPIVKKWVTIDEVRANIFGVPIPEWSRKGQFVFNRASAIYGDNFVRQLPVDPFYNDELIDPFISELTAALNKLN